jgi:DNA ligase 1
MAVVKYLLFVACVTYAPLICAAPPQVLLATVYDESKHDDISEYLVSEKFDGVRAIWTGNRLVTRKGHTINAPTWFTAPLPAIWLDGELWLALNKFTQVSGIVRTKTPNNDDWQAIRYQIFDMPDANLPFRARYKNYTELVKQLNVPHIKAVKQHHFASTELFTRYFTSVIAQGAEGVMLHRASAKYTSGRSAALLKLKPYVDAQAVVIEHLPGKGKYQGMLGAIKVITPQGRIVKIGTGFSDAQRKAPPLVGSTIMYRYQGLTKNGLPRFARFLRVRESL